MNRRSIGFDLSVIAVAIAILLLIHWNRSIAESRAATVESCDWMYAKAKLYAERGEKKGYPEPYDRINRDSGLSVMYSQLYLACQKGERGMRESTVFLVFFILGIVISAIWKYVRKPRARLEITAEIIGEEEFARRAPEQYAQWLATKEKSR